MTADSLLQVDSINRYYTVRTGLFGKSATVRALSTTSFNLQAGKTLAVVGESGCGKSTLARVISMIEPPGQGSFTLDGTTVKAFEPASAGIRSSVQLVFQDPYGSLNPRQKVSQILCEPLVINKPELSAAQREEQAREMLQLVGLRTEHYDRYPHMFSGGQRQRIAIARALMLKPKLLVLDEPVSALDLSIQSQILNLLVELQEQLKLTYLFISHDLSVVRHMADDILVMYLGRVVEAGSVNDIFTDPQHPYTQALLSATPVADPTLEKNRIQLQGVLPSPLSPPSGCAFNPRCWVAQDKCKVDSPELQKSGSHSVSCHFPQHS